MSKPAKLDEKYVHEWFEYGYKDLRSYLDLHWKFETFYERRATDGNQVIEPVDEHGREEGVGSAEGA